MLNESLKVNTFKIKENRYEVIDPIFKTKKPAKRFVAKFDTVLSTKLKKESYRDAILRIG